MAVWASQHCFDVATWLRQGLGQLGRDLVFGVVTGPWAVRLILGRDLGFLGHDRGRRSHA